LPYLLGGYVLNNLNSHKIRQNSIKNLVAQSVGMR
jgi:hypothetical protein